MKVSTLASGSSGNSVYIETEETKILIDAGISCKSITAKLGSIGVGLEELAAILVTHEHSDHIKGVGALSRKFDLPIYATEGTWLDMTSTVKEIAENNCRYLEINKSFEINDLKIEVFATSHDANEPVGFSFYRGDLHLGLATDTGYVTKSIRDHLDGANMLIIESNYDIEMLRKGRYPWFLKKRILSEKGHLSNDIAGRSLSELISGKTKKVVLAHLSAENNLPDLAKRTVASILAREGIEVGRDIDLDIAHRYESSPLYEMF